MSGPTRPPSGGAPRQPWTPEQAPKGVTCPACGLANEDGARVCRNCGLPIASATDPVRGVSPGRINMPSAQRSGLSATVGLVLVVGLLLVAGTLAVSGGGILSTGGRLGVDPTSSPSPTPAADGAIDQGTTVTTIDGSDPDDPEQTPVTIGTKLAYTCEAGAIKDLGRGKWFLSRLLAGSRPDDGYDQLTFDLSRDGGGKAKKATAVRLDWLDPTEARETYGAPARVVGSRALVLTFDGQVGFTTPRVFDSLLLQGEGVEQVRNIQLFEGPDGRIHAIVGVRGDSCARLEGKGWGKKFKGKNSKVLLQIERA